MNRRNKGGWMCSWIALILSAILVSASAPDWLIAQEAGVGETAATGFAQVSVKRTSVAEIDTSHLRIVVELVATAKRSVVLEHLQLTALKMNGLPVYAEPLAQAIDLQRGKETALPPMYITIQTRDLTSTEPLREMIEKQMAHIEGRMAADVQMSFLDKLAIHDEHPRVSLPLSQDVPVTLGSSPFARQAALGVLTLIDMGLKSTSGMRQSVPGLESPWVRALEEEANRSLYAVETSYMLREHGTKYPVISDQIGFRLTSGQVVTTAEVKAPWEYDAEFLGRMKSGEAKLEKSSVEIVLRPAGASAQTPAPLVLSHQDFTIEVRGEGERDALIVPKTPKKGHDAGTTDGQSANDDQREESRFNKPGDFAKIQLRRRASPNSLALMVLHAPPMEGGFAAAPAAIVEKDRWEKVAVYRLAQSGDGRGKVSVEVVQLSAHREGQQIRLDQPLDASFYGSPILAPEGVLGIVQDERVGAFLQADPAP